MEILQGNTMENSRNQKPKMGFYTILKVEAGYFVTGAVLGKGMLNVPAVLRCAVGAPNLRSIILEMTVKRDETAPVDAVIHQEQAAVVESRDYLVQELPKVTSFRCSL
jgi:hypothetical protein